MSTSYDEDGQHWFDDDDPDDEYCYACNEDIWHCVCYCKDCGDLTEDCMCHIPEQIRLPYGA